MTRLKAQIEMRALATELSRKSAPRKFVGIELKDSYFKQVVAELSRKYGLDAEGAK